jgi:predicted DNA repair protein MutK
MPEKKLHPLQKSEKCVGSTISTKMILSYKCMEVTFNFPQGSEIMNRAILFYDE